MIYGDSVLLKNQCLETECGFLNFVLKLKMYLLLLEQVNIAVNALLVQEAAEARKLLAAQNLAQCREETNPYLPQNNPFGPSRIAMWGPDPCAQQEKDLAAATVDHLAAQQLAQLANAPSVQDPSSAPAPILAETFDTPMNPMIPETEYTVPDPQLQNMWSPDTMLTTMDKLANILEQQNVQPSPEIIEEMEIIDENIKMTTLWDAWKKPRRRRRRYQFLPNNQSWIGKWTPLI